MKGKKLFILAVCVSFVLAMVVGVYAADNPKYGGVLRIIKYSGPGGPIGWHGGARDYVGTISAAACEPLVRVKLNLEVIPWLAERYEADCAGKKVTFFLRKGVKFHDGSDWNAKVCKWNLDLQLKAKKGGTNLWESVDILDDYTVQVKFKQWANTWTSTPLGSLPMISMAAYEKLGQKGIEWNPVGTGPFKFVSHKKDVETVFEKFDGYWQKGRPYLDGFKWIYIRDRMTQAAALEAGEGDVLYTQIGKTVNDLQKKGFPLIMRLDGLYNLQPDSKHPDSPWADERVRQAMNYAIDRDKLTRVIGYGLMVPAHQLAPVWTNGHIANYNAWPYNPEKAKKLLAEAGYPNGFKSTYSHYPGDPKNLVLTIQSYAKAVGIDLAIDSPDMGRLMSMRRAKGWKNGLMGGPNLLTPNFVETLYRYFHSSTHDYKDLMRNSELDALIDEAAGTCAPDKKLMEKATRYIMDHSMAMGINYTGAVRQFKPDIVRDSGLLEYSSQGGMNLERAWLNK